MSDPQAERNPHRYQKDAKVSSGTYNNAADASAAVALSIDGSGNVFGYAEDDSGKLHAVEWSPVPEPSALVLAGLAGGIAWCWRSAPGCGVSPT